MRVVLAHDWLVGYRGGEAVLERIARLLREDGHEIAALYTMFDDGRPLAPTVDSLKKVVSPLSRVPGGSGALRRWMLPLYPRAVAWLSSRLARERGIDLLISTSSAAIKGLTAPKGARHICYCHSPARYVWGMEGEYGARRGEGIKGILRAAGLRAFAGSFKAWDARTAREPSEGGSVDEFLANSTHTAAMIERCYGRRAEVVFPPVRVAWLAGPELRRTSFWLAAGALEPYKRVDLAIKAAAVARASLLVAGSGSQRTALERLARELGADVQFLGRVSDEQLREVYRSSRLLVFPQIEDFGITAVEAQACGTPVVARRAGGALDTVVEGVTGSFFDKPTAEALAAAAQRCPPPGPACVENAQRFREEVFDAAIRRVIERVRR